MVMPRPLGSRLAQQKTNEILQDRWIEKDVFVGYPGTPCRAQNLNNSKLDSRLLGSSSLDLACGDLRTCVGGLAGDLLGLQAPAMMH